MVMKKKVGTKAKTGMMRTPKNQMLHIPQLAKKKTTLFRLQITDSVSLRLSVALYATK